MARAMGGEVYTTAGSEEKCRALEALGATRAINYQEADFEDVLTETGMKDRINVILDMAGGDFIQKNINIAAPEARIVYIAFIRGFKAEVNFAPLLMKRITLSGSTLRAQSPAQKAVMTREIREHICPHLENGNIKPVVDRVFKLAEVAQAHEYMQSGAHMGKIILCI
jgi:NADPH:quinone reductase-like Zn-dependent oxidoreductase